MIGPGWRTPAIHPASKMLDFYEGRNAWQSAAGFHPAPHRDRISPSEVTMKKEFSSRRSFLTSAVTTATAFQIVKPELVRGAGDEKLKAGLIGAGSRGTTAVQNILPGCPNVELTAMADVFEDRLEGSLRTLGRLADVGHRRELDIGAPGENVLH